MHSLWKLSVIYIIISSISGIMGQSAYYETPNLWQVYTIRFLSLAADYPQYTETHACSNYNQSLFT